MIFGIESSYTYRRDGASNNPQQYRANGIGDGLGKSQQFNSNGRPEEGPPPDTVLNIPEISTGAATRERTDWRVTR
jgi:hypothetical protein